MSRAPMTKAPGATISFKEDFVEIAMHLSKSGKIFVLPVKIDFPSWST